MIPKTLPTVAGYVVTIPRGVMFPIRPVPANHIFPSGPFVMFWGFALGVGIGKSVVTPSVVILPILLASVSVNQRAPSGPSVIPYGVLFGVGAGKDGSSTPPVVIRRMTFLFLSVSHRFPSGPATRPSLFSVATGYSVMVPKHGLDDVAPEPPLCARKFLPESDVRSSRRAAVDHRPIKGIRRLRG